MLIQYNECNCFIQSESRHEFIKSQIATRRSAVVIDRTHPNNKQERPDSKSLMWQGRHIFATVSDGLAV